MFRPLLKTATNSLPFKIFLFAIISLCILISLYSTPSQKTTQKTVAITQIISHPALNKERDGIIQALKEAGFEQGKNLKIQTDDAQGNIAIATQIATRYASIAPDVVVGISTPSAQALIQPLGRTNVPVVFAAVTDPLTAKLVKALEKRQEDVTGVTCAVPVEPQLAFMKQILPELKTIGVIYNPGESNAVATVEKIQLAARDMGIEVITSTATKSSDVKPATEAVLEKVQAVLLANDNTTASAIEAILSTLTPKGIPVFSDDMQLIEKGVLGGKAVDHFLLGMQAGEQVVQILKGAKASEIVVEPPKVIRAMANKAAAEALKISFPQEIEKDLKWVDISSESGVRVNNTSAKGETKMTHELPPLPYAMNALEPHISERTVSFHYGKHHQTYVTNLNNLLKNHSLEGKSLQDVIMMSHGKSDMVGIFNNAAQVWNHTFFWNCMKPAGGGQPSPAFLSEIVKAFGSFDEFKAQFKQAALTQFGSGWAWLVSENGTLKIMKTANADLPMTQGAVALLTIDVWEHAYYLDYQNRRTDFIDAFLNHLVNWAFVEENFKKVS